jgi:hypothetical protein
VTWLEPMWLAYPTAALALLTLVFAGSVRWWLKQFPVPELNYAYEAKYRMPRPRDLGPMNFTQVFAATASSAVAWIPGVSAVYHPDVPAGYRAP